MVKKVEHHVSIRLECKDRTRLLQATQLTLTHFRSHLVCMAVEEGTLVAWLTPLDESLFAPREGLRFIAETVRQCFPYDYAEVIYRKYRKQLPTQTTQTT